MYVLTVALSVVVSRGPCEVTLFLRHVATGPVSRVGEKGKWALEMRTWLKLRQCLQSAALKSAEGYVAW